MVCLFGNDMVYVCDAEGVVEIAMNVTRFPKDLKLYSTYPFPVACHLSPFLCRLSPPSSSYTSPFFYSLFFASSCGLLSTEHNK